MPALQNDYSTILKNFAHLSIYARFSGRIRGSFSQACCRAGVLFFLPAFGNQTDFLYFRVVFPGKRRVQTVDRRPDSLRRFLKASSLPIRRRYILGFDDLP